jgi:hypothetical protein
MVGCEIEVEDPRIPNRLIVIRLLFWIVMPNCKVVGKIEDGRLVLIIENL